VKAWENAGGVGVGNADRERLEAIEFDLALQVERRLELPEALLDGNLPDRRRADEDGGPLVGDCLSRLT